MVNFTRKLLPLVKANLYRCYCVAICVTILSVFCGILYVSLNIVTVENDNQIKTVLSLFSNPYKLLEVAKVNISDDDKIISTSFSDGYQNITITKPFTVSVNVDGQTIKTKMHNGTVKDCLLSAGIKLGKHDFTSPSLHSPLNNGDTVQVFRVEYKDTQYEETVPYGTDYKSNSLGYRFKKRQYVLKEGVNGKNLVTYRERYVDGALESKHVTNIETITHPVNQQVLRYEKSAISPLPAPDGITIVNNVPSSYKRVLTNVPATGYSASRGRGASGLGLYCGTVAVNPNVIPYGSKLYITSPDGQFIYGFAIATDTGSALMEGHVGIDLFYDTFKEASLNWKNIVNVYIL